MELEVKDEMSRVQRNQLRTTLYGQPSSPPKLPVTPQTVQMKIYNIEEVESKEAFRVSYAQLGTLQKQANTMENGEDKLKDLQKALGSNAEAIPCPEVEKVDEARYNKMYPKVYDKMPSMIRTPGELRHSGDSESDASDYDMDEYDEEFLNEQKKKCPNFKVTESVFERTIQDLLTLNKKGKKDAQRLSTELYKTDKYPSSVLSREEVLIISEYFVNKSKKTDIIPWQPSHHHSLKESNKSPYKIFRPIIPRVEPKVLRSHKNIVPLEVADNLHKRAKRLKETFVEYNDSAKKQENEGLEQRSKIFDKIRNLEDSWNNGDIGEPVKKCLPLYTNKLNLQPFVRLARLNSKDIKACKSLIQPAKLTYISSNKVTKGITGTSNINNELNQTPASIPLPMPSNSEIMDLMKKMSTSSNNKENTNTPN